MSLSNLTLVGLTPICGSRKLVLLRRCVLNCMIRRRYKLSLDVDSRRADSLEENMRLFLTCIYMKRSPYDPIAWNLVKLQVTVTPTS